MRSRILLASLLCMSSPLFAGEIRSEEVIQELPFYALSLLGTPYKYGGSQPETGLDCSGFVRHVFNQVAGIQLPRSSQEISHQGDPLEPHELQPGDLVFFNTLDQAFSHVGLYLGENRFIHASSSSTGMVTLSNMSQPYWSGRFDGARRLIRPNEGLSDPHL